MKILTADIGGSFIKYALADESGDLSAKGKIPTPENREKLVDAIGSLYESFHGMDSPQGIAISIPGIIDSLQGCVIMGGALEYNNGFQIRKALTQRCGCEKISVNNDAKCAAQAEASVGALRGVKDGAVILFGTMIGGGIVLDGKVRQGVHSAAGEVSYILTQPDCLPDRETVWGKSCSTLKLCGDFAVRKKLPEECVDGEKVFEALEKGDRDAHEALTAYTSRIAVQLFSLQTVLDLERIAIGGGISAREKFIEYIKDRLNVLYTSSPYYVPQAEIVRCQFGNDANLIGAAQCWLTSHL